MSFVNSLLNILRFNKNNWKAVVLCILAATIFWFFNALNKNYTTTINFPLAFDYDHEGFVTVRPLPGAVRINVTGIGWNLFRRSAGLKVPPLVIPLERPADVKKIVGSTLPGFFANQLADFQINFVLTDTLHIAIEPKKIRKVALDVELPAILFRQGYVLVSDISIVPDSVTLEGPQPLITGLTNPVHLQIQQRNIDEDFEEAIDVKFLNDELIKRDPASVKVKFDVERLMEVSDSVQLQVINAPRQARPVIEQGKVPYTLGIPESYVNDFHPDSLKAVVDLADLPKGEKKILPHLIGIPPFSKIVGLDSVSVKF